MRRRRQHAGRTTARPRPDPGRTGHTACGLWSAGTATDPLSPYPGPYVETRRHWLYNRALHGRSSVQGARPDASPATISRMRLRTAEGGTVRRRHRRWTIRHRRRGRRRRGVRKCEQGRGRGHQRPRHRKRAVNRRRRRQRQRADRREWGRRSRRGRRRQPRAAHERRRRRGPRAAWNLWRLKPHEQIIWVAWAHAEFRDEGGGDRNVRGQRRVSPRRGSRQPHVLARFVARSAATGAETRFSWIAEPTSAGR